MYISVKQGTIRGVSPKSAEKIIDYYLFAKGSETRAVASSKISSNWTNLTLYGNILAVAMIAVFWWIASDIETYLNTGKASVWSWLSAAYGYPDFQITLLMINLTKLLAIILVGAIAVEILIVLYVYPRVDAFAEESLKKLP